MKTNNYITILNSSLASMEKLLLIDLITDIGQLSDENCFSNFTNEEIAKHLSCSPSCVSKTITSLRKKGIIEYYSFDGKRRTIKILLHSK